MRSAYSCHAWVVWLVARTLHGPNRHTPAGGIGVMGGKPHTEKTKGAELDGFVDGRVGYAQLRRCCAQQSGLGATNAAEFDFAIV